MTVAVITIKPFGLAKQRLRGFPRRRELAAWMAAMVLNAAADAALVHRVLVVTADSVAASLARAVGAAVVAETVPLGHSVASRRGMEHAVDLGATKILVLSADCPLVTGVAIDELLTSTEQASVVIATDRHGTGTNALLLTPPNAIEPAFGKDSRKRHETRAGLAGLACRVVHDAPFAHDVDTPADLDALAMKIVTDPSPQLTPLRRILSGDAPYDAASRGSRAVV